MITGPIHAALGHACKERARHYAPALTLALALTACASRPVAVDGVWSNLPAPPATEAKEFDDDAQARAYARDLGARGIATEIKTERRLSRLTTLSVGSYTHRFEAELVLGLLQKNRIDAWIYPLRNGKGFMVHAGAMLDPRNVAERRAQLEALGFQNIVVGQKRTFQEGYRVIPQDDAPPRSRPASEPAALKGSLLRGDFSAWRDGSKAMTGNYFNASLTTAWHPEPTWLIRAGLRLDATEQSGATSFRRASADYEETFAEFRTPTSRWAVGAQKIQWGGGMLESLADRLSTVDYTRYLLDPDIALRRRANLAVRWERAGEDYDTDMVWQPLFRPAVLPEADSIWSPIDTSRGRILGLQPTDTLKELVKNGSVMERPPSVGGLGLRLWRSRGHHYRAVTLQYTAASLPYYRLDDNVRTLVAGGTDPAAAVAAASSPTFTTAHPTGWVFSVTEENRLWRFETAVLSAVPVTYADYRMDTVNAVEWAIGAKMRLREDPGTGFEMQLAGRRLGTDAEILDRAMPIAVSGAVIKSTPGSPWRFGFDFLFGLDALEIHVNPRVEFTDRRYYRLALGTHLFMGASTTASGYHNSHSLVSLSWQANL